jgi:DNA-binding winged helix-turn-helix (wHTH) protein/Tfp pilus assembly protein PilF
MGIARLAIGGAVLTTKTKGKIVERLAFGRFLLDSRHRVLFRDGTPIPATPKTFDLLEFLASRAGQVLTKEEIIQHVWRGQVVTDANLVQHILLLRRLLGEDYRANRYVVTIPKQGYRFVIEPQRSLAIATTDSDEAFRAFCHGQYLLQQRTFEGLRDAVRWFELAVFLDERFAMAHAGLAAGSAMLGIYMHVGSQDAFPRARAAASRALELTQEAAGAHSVLAEVRCYFDGDWEGAKAEHHRALALQPESAEVRHSLAWLYVCTGELDQALTETGLALRLDPSSLTIAANRAVILSYLGRYAEAIEQLGNVLELAPQFSLARYFYACALVGAGEYELALNELLFVHGFRSHTLALEAECHARLGNVETARPMLADLLALPAPDYVSPYLLARVYLALDEPEYALLMLDRSRRERVAWTAFALVDPIFASLKDLPTFKLFTNAIRSNMR